MRIRRLKVLLLAASLSATALFVGAGAAFASAGGCTFGSSSGNTQTCFQISGQGLFVNSMFSGANIVNSGSARTLQACIHGPDAALPKCSPFVFVRPGDIPVTQSWFPNRNVPGGTYCGRTWRQNNDGSHTLIGEVCFTVHP